MLQYAVGELAANVVEHAKPGAASPNPLRLEATLTRRSAAVEVSVSDDGTWRSSPERPPELRGRGLPTARRLADKRGRRVD